MLSVAGNASEDMTGSRNAFATYLWNPTTNYRTVCFAIFYQIFEIVSVLLMGINFGCLNENRLRSHKKKVLEERQPSGI